jgi:hypothetical protein
VQILADNDGKHQRGVEFLVSLNKLPAQGNGVLKKNTLMLIELT